MRTLHLCRSLTGKDLEAKLASRHPRAVQTVTKEAAIEAMEQKHRDVALALPTGKDMDINGYALKLGYIVNQECMS